MSRPFTAVADPPLLDVAVVGGGPAGCSAAVRLAAAGLDTALVSDASGAQPEVDVLLTAVAARTLRETPLLRLAAHHAVEEIRLRLPARPPRTLTDVGAFSIRRSALSDALFFAAMAAGARLRPDRADAIERAEWGFEITTISRRVPLRARHLILAGGGGGIGAPAAAGDADARPALAVAARFAGRCPPGAAQMEMLFVPPEATALRTPALSLWAFPGPADGVLTVRVVAVNHDGGDRDALLGRGLDALRAEAYELGSLTPLGKVAAGVLDTGYSRRRLVDADGILVGDAAGLVNPFTGEGLSYALESGALAAAAVLEHRDDPAAAKRAYVRRVDAAFAGSVEASRRALRRDHLAWRFLSDAAESDHPFHAKGRRAILLPEGLRGITDPLIASLERRLQLLAGPFLVACDEVMISTIRDDWPFLGRMAITELGTGERLRPALLLLAAALAAGGELDPRDATLGGALELAMMGATAFLGVASDVREQRGLDWGQVSIVVGGDFLLGQAARLIARSGPEISWSFAEWLLELATLRAQRLAGRPGVTADATIAALYELPARLGAELAGADAATVATLRDVGSACGRAFLHVDEVLALSGRRTRLDTTLDYMAANRIASDGLAPGGDAARTAEQLHAARAATAEAERRGRASIAQLADSPGRELLAAFLTGVCAPAHRRSTDDR